MTDWKGNNIEAGMEVCFILINNHTPQINWLVGGEVHVMQEASDEPCLEVGEYGTVQIDSNGKPFITIVTKGANELEGYTFNFQQYLDSPFIDTKNLILAIKGISDTK